MSYSYEDEKRDALASYLLSRPALKEEWEFKERSSKMMKIKIDLKIIGRTAIKNFKLKCNEIIRGIKK